MSHPLLTTRYSYQARDPQGQLVQGFIAANSPADALKQLRTEGKFVVDIQAIRPGGEAIGPTAGNIRGRVSRDELINFTVQLSVMVDTGVPLSEALGALADQAFSPNFIAILKAILDDVTGGRDFSTTLERFPRLFPRYYVALVRAAEVSGTLAPVLRRLAEHLTGSRETIRRVRGAMLYPAFMLVMCTCVTIFLLTAILPRFTAIFAARRAALPMPTQVLIHVSNSLIHYWPWWVAGVVGVVGLLSWFLPTRRGQRTLDYLKLHTPIIGPMFHKLALSRSLRTLGVMTGAGVPMNDALPVVREVAGNGYFGELWDDVRLKLQAGQQLSDPLLRSRLIPRSVAQMILSGEKTGELPAVIQRIAGFMEDDLRTAIRTATQFIEPLLIGTMGAIIGGIAIAMLLPIMTISRVMVRN